MNTGAIAKSEKAKYGKENRADKLRSVDAVALGVIAKVARRPVIRSQTAVIHPSKDHGHLTNKNRNVSQEIIRAV